MLARILLAVIAMMSVSDKPRIEIPLRFDTTAVVEHTVKSRATDDSPKRLHFQESRDEVENLVQREIAINLVSMIYEDRSALGVAVELLKWRVILTTTAKGVSTIELRRTSMDTKAKLAINFGAVVSKDSLRLIFRPGDESISRACTVLEDRVSVGSRTQDIGFAIDADDVLSIADAGTVRIKWGETSEDLKLTDIDREALRWFVWEKVPGGQERIRQRYTLVDRKPAAK